MWPEERQNNSSKSEYDNIFTNGWNARGKADRRAVEEALSVEKLGETSYPYLAGIGLGASMQAGEVWSEEKQKWLERTNKNLIKAIRKQIMDELWGYKKC